MSTYLLLSDDRDFEARARGALGLTNGQLVRRPLDAIAAGSDANAGDGLRMDGGGTFDVIAVGPGVSPSDAVTLAARIDLARPESNVLIVVDDGLDPSHLEHAIAVGVRGVITSETHDVELAEVFQRAARQAARRRQSLAGSGPGEGVEQRTIVLLSPKGGSGKTMLAVNLAAALASHPSARVALVDLDLAFGDAASALGLVPEYSFASLYDVPRLDRIALKVFLTPHPPTGLYTLCAPEDPADAGLITPEAASDVIGHLATEFTHVVVDTSAGVSDHTLAALDVATDVLLVCTMDVASVRGLRKAVDALDELGHTSARRTFVLNRAASRVGLLREDIERTVGLPVTATVPSHRSVPATMNQGAPLVASTVRSPARAALLALRDQFVRQPASTSAWTSMRSWSS